MLEFEVAMILLGIAMTGLFPLVAIYSRTVSKFEYEMYQEGVMTLPNPLGLDSRLPIQGYLVPSSSAWARKLGAAAQVTTKPPSSATAAFPLIDDGALGYSDSGWTLTQSDSGAFNGHYRTTSTTGGKATWLFSGVPQGWYQIAVTWPSASETTWPLLTRSTSAAYSISDGTVPGTLNPVGTTVTMDQTRSPGGQGLRGFTDASGFPWQFLHTAVLLSGPNVQIQLSPPNPNPSNLSVAASAVQLIPINNVAIQSLTRTLELSGGTGVTAQVTVRPGGPPQ